MKNNARLLTLLNQIADEELGTKLPKHEHNYRLWKTITSGRNVFKCRTFGGCGRRITLTP